ncbi:hypothetical protein T492DRAFT_108088 [Pavlovales sp. CCMP2436]|nr:hypothetical protein T492DRAFT_108088 [Pavlovales sp. CCMP2436]
MARFRGRTFLISPQVDATTSADIGQLLLTEGAVSAATPRGAFAYLGAHRPPLVLTRPHRAPLPRQVAADEAMGLDDCNLYVTHLSAGQLAQGEKLGPHSRSNGLRMILMLNADLNWDLNSPAAQLSNARGGGGAAGGEGQASSLRSGLIASPRLGPASDSVLRRALRLPNVDCVSARCVCVCARVCACVSVCECV